MNENAITPLETALEPLDVAPNADALANEVSSLCGQLTPRQARYLGHLITTQVVSESAKPEATLQVFPGGLERFPALSAGVRFVVSLDARGLTLRGAGFAPVEAMRAWGRRSD